MLLTFLIIGLASLMLLVLRFVQPELIYSLREGTIAVGANYAFLEQEAGRSHKPNTLTRLLIKDFRHVTRLHEPRYVLKRVLKLRELYRLIDSRRSARPGDPGDPQPQICIVELSHLVGNLASHLVPRDDYQGPVVNASAVLRYVINQRRLAKGEPDINEEKDIEKWLTDNPVSIEQAIELLCAVAFALAYRQSAENAVGSLNTGRTSRAVEQLDHLAHILEIERKLRILVRDFYDSVYGLGEATSDRFRSHLGTANYQRALDLMGKARSAQPTVSLEVLDYVYLRDLGTLLFVEWDHLPKGVFHEKKWLSSRLEHIVKVRNVTSHARHVSQGERALAVAYCDDLGPAIQVATEQIRSGKVRRPSTEAPEPPSKSSS